MRLSRIWQGVWLVALAGFGSSAAGFGSPARAQYIDTYLPPAVPGFDREEGVTVLSRLRPLYADPGIRLGSWLVRGGVDETIGYDSNITGWSNAPKSAFLETAPSISALSDWSRNRLGFSANLDQHEYFSAPQESYTNYNVAVGGGWMILRNDLNVGYSHQHGHEFGNDIGALAYGVPVTYDIDTIRSDYTYDLGRLQFTPNANLQLFRYNSFVVSDQPVSQWFRDRTVFSGGVTTRYSLSEQRSLLLVLQGANSHYVQPQPGTPSANSRSVLVLPGLDYQANGPWRYRFLAGAEFRAFEAPQFRSRLAPIFEGSVIYTPTGLTTITGSVRRAIEEPEAEGTSGYTFTGAKLVVDHEYLRNMLLQVRGEFGSVQYFQTGGRSSKLSAGASAVWMVNDHLSLSANYQYTHQDGTGDFQPNSATQSLATRLPSYTQNFMLISARWRL